MSRATIDRDEELAWGTKIFNNRVKAGLSRQELGRAIGVSFQQIAKYESGADRISVSRLVRIAKALKIPVVDFFDMPGHDENISIANSRLCIENSRNFAAIKDKKQQKALNALAKVMARSDG